MITQKKDNGIILTESLKPMLPGIVKAIVEIKGNGQPASLRLYPRNTPEILINLAEPLHGRIDNHRLVADGTTIQGSKKTFMDVEHPRDCHFISIRFTTNAFYKLFGISQKEFTDRLFDLGDVVNDKGNLIPKLKNTQTTQDRFELINDWLQQLISQTEMQTDLVSDFIISQISRDPTLTVSELTVWTGYTRKHLAQRFKEEAGLTIKEYQKIYRIYRILRQIESENHPSWPKLACEAGFYDQSHLIRDFKRLTGYTPTEYSRPTASETQ